MILEVKDITKSFGNKQILKGVSFSVESGKALGLLGKNGAGKTTTIRILMDVFHADSGEIQLDGKSFDIRKIRTGYLPEERGLYPTRTVAEQMIYLAKLKGIDKKQAVVNMKKWLKRLQILQYEKRKLETLSKGNQQKVQLAATLVCDPELIVLDEPFSGLDPVNARILQEVVKELIEEGKMVVFSSHQMNYIEEFCENIVIINNGSVVLKGDLNEIKKEFGNQQLVLGDVSLSQSELEDKLREQLSSLCEVTGRTKEDVIIKMTEGTTRRQILEAVMNCREMELEHFETYKPSLNDIFVAKAGEEG